MERMDMKRLLNLCLIWLALLCSCKGQSRSVSFSQLMSGGYEEIEYKRADGKPLKMYAFYPADSVGKGKTAVMIIHGGGWTGGDTGSFFPHARYFASRGAAAFCIDYRLVKSGCVTLAECLSDCKSAIRYIRKNAMRLGIDSNKIMVIGDSAGGHLAACLGTVEGYDDAADDLTVSDAPDMAVLCNPLTDFTSSGYIRVVIGGDALNGKGKLDMDTVSSATIAAAKSFSPLYNVRKNGINTLLMHGTSDTVIPCEQSERLYEKLKAAGNTCSMITLPGARHAFICAKWRASEEVVVNAVRMVDEYMCKYGFLEGRPTLAVSSPVAWEPKK